MSDVRSCPSCAGVVVGAYGCRDARCPGRSDFGGSPSKKPRTLDLQCRICRREYRHERSTTNSVVRQTCGLQTCAALWRSQQSAKGLASVTNNTEAA